MKLHYFAFSFSDADGNKITTASCYIGFQCKNITLARVKEAKQGAGVSAKAVLIACSYLGYMKSEEFKELTND